MISGWKFKLIKACILIQVFWLALMKYKSPGKTRQAIRGLLRTRDEFLDKHKRNKYAYIQGKWWLGFSIPGWPSKAFNRFILHFFHTLENPADVDLTTLIFAITKKCGFQCEHCLEWNNLNKPETLTREDLLNIVNRFHEMGVSLVQFSGGEPINRLRDLLYVMKNGPKDIEYWMYSNGYALNKEKIILLKQSGLTGIAISIDHYNEKAHDQFRGVPGSFKHAVESARLCREYKIAVTLSICVTHDMASETNLMKYAALAKENGVQFIQLLEPKAVGHYAGKNVGLNTEELNILESFFLDLNFKSTFKDFPIVMYHGFYSRRIGCLGGGKDYVYVDTNGYVHSCPFCQSPLYNVLGSDFHKNLLTHKQQGCKMYPEIFNPVKKLETQSILSP